MDQAALRRSIEDWDRFYRTTRANLIRRSVASELSSRMGTAVLGVRRCGKTCAAIQMSLPADQNDVLYYNFEDPLFVLGNDVANLDLVLRVAAEVKGRAPRVLLLDEIQNVNAWERWLRKILDQREHQVVVTGSSAKLLSRELATALAGRCLEVPMWPLSFGEYLQFSRRDSDRRDDLLAALRLYLQWGGFPEVSFSEDDAWRTRLLRQYLSDIVLKDVMFRNDLRNQTALMQVLTFYLTNISSPHSLSSLKNAFGIGSETAERIVAALHDAFVIFPVPRYHPNMKVQSRDAHKIYAIDTGLRNVGSRSAQEDFGKLLENAVYIELLRRGCEVSYFRGKQEVDFVVTDHYRPVSAIQVCASDLAEAPTREREINALVECLQSLSLPNGIIVTWDRQETITVAGKEIQLIPAYEWLRR